MHFKNFRNQFSLTPLATTLPCCYILCLADTWQYNMEHSFNYFMNSISSAICLLKTFLKIQYEYFNKIIFAKRKYLPQEEALNPAVGRLKILYELISQVTHNWLQPTCWFIHHWLNKLIECLEDWISDDWLAFP